MPLFEGNCLCGKDPDCDICGGKGYVWI